MSDLIPAGAMTNQQGVPTIQGYTAEIPNVPTGNIKYYHCSVGSASVIRRDGMKLNFRFNIYETEFAADQELLDVEAASPHNVYVRMATQAEIDAYRMHMNPVQVYKDKATAEMTSEIADRVKAELLERLSAAGIDVSALDTSKLFNPRSQTVSLNVSPIAERLASIRSGSGTVMGLGGITNTADVSTAMANGLSGSL